MSTVLSIISVLLIVLRWIALIALSIVAFLLHTVIFYCRDIDFFHKYTESKIFPLIFFIGFPSIAYLMFSFPPGFKLSIILLISFYAIEIRDMFFNAYQKLKGNK